eukprot:5339351-Prymnesium_polylepis.2
MGAGKQLVHIAGNTDRERFRQGKVVERENKLNTKENITVAPAQNITFFSAETLSYKDASSADCDTGYTPYTWAQNYVKWFKETQIYYGGRGIRH